MLIEAGNEKADKQFLRELRLRAQEQQVKNAEESVSEPSAPVPVPTGRPAKRDKGFAILAGTLWRDAKGASPQVSIDALEHIAAELDHNDYVPPANYLALRTI